MTLQANYCYRMHNYFFFFFFFPTYLFPKSKYFYLESGSFLPILFCTLNTMKSNSIFSYTFFFFPPLYSFSSVLEQFADYPNLIWPKNLRKVWHTISLQNVVLINVAHCILALWSNHLANSLWSKGEESIDLSNHFFL